MIAARTSTRKVYIGGVWLDPARSQKLHNHSPDGFAWGYAGSGPAQLALAILQHFTDDEFALQHYQAFKHDVIIWQPQDRNLSIPDKKVKDWAKKRGWK